MPDTTDIEHLPPRRRKKPKPQFQAKSSSECSDSGDSNVGSIGSDNGIWSDNEVQSNSQPPFKLGLVQSQPIASPSPSVPEPVSNTPAVVLDESVQFSDFNFQESSGDNLQNVPVILPEDVINSINQQLSSNTVLSATPTGTVFHQPVTLRNAVSLQETVNNLVLVTQSLIERNQSKFSEWRKKL